jgi:hypothetical protein
MPPAASRKWDYAVIGVTLLIASYLLFVPPIVGVADQGDYLRVTARVGLTPPPGIPYRINSWLVTHWNIVAAQPLQTFSTGEFPVRAAILLHKVATGATTLDIRWVSGVYLALFLGLILAVLRSARRLPAAAYFVIAAGLVLVCTDSEYLSYFNSFLTEPAALLGVFAFVAAGLCAVTAGDPSWFHMAVIVLAAAFLAGGKAQNAVLGAFAACWLTWLFKDKPAQRYASIAAGLALVCFSGFVLTRAPLPQSNLFNAIYDRVLPNSMDPPGTLAELGLKPETAAWKDLNYWDVTIESPDVYPRKVTRLTLLAFYLRHPFVDLRMARGALSLSNDFTESGNFPRESGAPRLTRTQAFTGYDRLRARLSSLWFVVPLLAANIAAVFIWRRPEAGLISTLGIMAAVAFLIGAFYDTSPLRHLFTFNLLFDVLLFADLSAAAVRVARIRASLPIFGYLARMLVALFLLLTLGFALRLEVFPRGFLKTTYLMPNLAEGKLAAQSSTWPGDSSAAFSAVDGNTDGNFYRSSVTSTNLDPNAWWQVDLDASKTIGSVVIWNRTDCCSSRLSDYWVFISDVPFNPSDTPATLQDRAVTWKSHQTVAPNPYATIATHGAKGRYVRVQLTGTGYLSLAEVQVSALGPDLAVGKPATQSSDLPGSSGSGAGAAVDGNISGEFSLGTVTSTNLDPHAWWQVDIGASTAIDSLAIWNRTDCCPSRLSDYWVFISDTPFSPSDTPAKLKNRAGTWKSHRILPPDPSTTIKTSGANGRYVRVQLTGTDYLSLAEVQVFGQ